jgi:hypothetical protein
MSNRNGRRRTIIQCEPLNKRKDTTTPETFSPTDKNQGFFKNFVNSEAQSLIFGSVQKE